MANIRSSPRKYVISPCLDPGDPNPGYIRPKLSPSAEVYRAPLFQNQSARLRYLGLIGFLKTLQNGSMSPICIFARPLINSPHHHTHPTPHVVKQLYRFACLFNCDVANAAYPSVLRNILVPRFRHYLRRNVSKYICLLSVRPKHWRRPGITVCNVMLRRSQLSDSSPITDIASLPSRIISGCPAKTSSIRENVAVFTTLPLCLLRQ